MLDVPVYLRGRLVGVVCHEHVGGDRAWDDGEQLFAMAIGQLVALAMEARRREQAEEALRTSELRFRSMVEAAPVPIVVTSYPADRVLYGNRALAEAARVEPEADASLGLHADPAERATLLAELAERGRVTDREVQVLRADGSPFWALLSMVPIDFAGEPAVINAFVDLTERKQLEERLRVLALHDPLTGLANRALFYDLIRLEIARADRDPDHRFALLYLDVDDLKGVNDRSGHEAGDLLLTTIAGRLERCLRTMDVAARLGGDEFAVLLPGVADTAEAVAVARRVAAAVREPVEHRGIELRPSASFGVAIGEGGCDPAELLRSADTAMYRAKKGADPDRIAWAE
jgi:diguanylate cyclase (GGDEF)-like protein/PAS domain S-box-containing protein